MRAALVTAAAAADPVPELPGQAWGRGDSRSERLRLDPATSADASEVAGWARSAEEARWWAGQGTTWPVSVSVVGVWLEDPGVEPFVLREDGSPVAAGELWVDEEEQEVELGRLIVRPDRRGRGLGRLLVARLLERAVLAGVSVAFVRVVPGNAAALACYRAAGFARVSQDEERRYNRGQPLEYVWLWRRLTA